MSLGAADLPALYRAADATSLGGQRRYLWAIRLALLGSVVAAAGGAGATASDRLEWLAWVAVGAFMLAIGSSLYIALLKPDKAWYDGRAAAESAKSLAWEYAVGGGPFCVETCTDPDDLLVSRLSEIVTRLRDFAVAGDDGAGEQVTPKMRALRDGDLAVRRSSYVSDRVDDQRKWYSTKAKLNGRLYNAWLIAALAAQGAGLTLGFLLATGKLEFDALSVLAAVAAAVTAWVQTKDHGQLAEAYGIAAQELALAKVGLETAETEERAWAQLVDDAEQAVSREHTLWIARRGSVFSIG